jgi:antitoxin component of MazEF toxin-antitoxin module
MDFFGSRDAEMAAVQRWGNSLAVRIPARLAESLSMREGTQVDIECPVTLRPC